MIETAVFKGSARGRGEQHGALFGQRTRASGIMDFYCDYVARQAGGGVLGSAALGLLHAHFARRLSPQAKELIQGFSLASGLDAPRLSRATVMPDVMNFLIGLNGRLTAAPLGCTSVAAWGDYTQDGRLLYGRNLDFPGNGLFDRAPLVSRHFPDSGMPYVTVGTAGSVVDGITGINEAGLTLALHQHINTNVAYLPSGRCVLDLGLEILQHAATIEEAEALACGWGLSSGWTLMLTHWKQKRAAAIEITPKRVVVIHSKERRFVRANTFADPALRAREIESPSFRESSRLRQSRAEALLDSHQGRVDASVMASILGDHVDAERGLVRAFTQTIAQAHNMTSVVFDPERGLLWLAEGTAPVCDSPYRKVELWTQGPAGETLPIRTDPLSSDQRRAVESYQKAVRAWELSHDAAAAMGALKDCARLDPADPGYLLMQGLFALKTGAAAAAAESFAAGSALPDITHRVQTQRFWRARALDLCGARARAVKLYEEVSRTAVSVALRRAAVVGAGRPYASGEIRPDFFHLDTFGY